MNKRTQKSNAKSSTFFGGAAILAASIAVVKVIGALYKIPLGRILGDVGFGHFNNAYAIYNLLLMVSTAGLPVAMGNAVESVKEQCAFVTATNDEDGVARAVRRFVLHEEQ